MSVLRNRNFLIKCTFCSDATSAISMGHTRVNLLTMQLLPICDMALKRSAVTSRTKPLEQLLSCTINWTSLTQKRRPNAHTHSSGRSMYTSTRRALPPSLLGSMRRAPISTSIRVANSHAVSVSHGDVSAEAEGTFKQFIYSQFLTQLPVQTLIWSPPQLVICLLLCRIRNKLIVRDRLFILMEYFDSCNTPVLRIIKQNFLQSLDGS